MSDSLAEAAMRLEAAVERLARVAARVPARAEVADGATGGVSAEDVAALSARLEATIARLRAVLPEAELETEEAGLSEADLPDEARADEARADGALPDEARADEGGEPGDGPRVLPG